MTTARDRIPFTFLATENMARYSVNSKGRTFIHGKSIEEDLRASIIDSIIAEGGDPGSGYFGGKYKEVADRYRVTGTFVSKLWRTFCDTGEHLTGKKRSGNPSHLKREDVELIDFLKKEKPSKTYQSIKHDLLTYCTLEGGTSLTAIGNVVRNKIPEGPFTRKRLTKPSSEKFTPQNLLYCQQFIDTVSSLPPEKLKFFDEAGVHCGIGNPVYGHSLKGTPAIEVIRGNLKGANITLSLLCGLEGVLYANTVDGASDSTNFLNFFGEAGQVTTANGNPALVGDYIILDNCATHRFESGDILQRWLMQMGASIIYTPSLSPEFNAAEFVFNKMKTVLKKEEFGPRLRANVHVAVYEALDYITTDDMFGFYNFIL